MNEDRLKGAGVYYGYGAGASEAMLCAKEHVFVVGGGNSAGQAAMHFSSRARKVSVVIRGDGLKQTLSQYLADRILAAPDIEVLPHTEVTALQGDDMLQAITLTNNQTGRQQTFQTRWLFLHGIARDEAGYFLTGPNLRRNGRYPENWPLEREPFHLETSTPGLFAAGDVRHGSVKRCAAAVGEGAMAVTLVTSMKFGKLRHELLKAVRNA